MWWSVVAYLLLGMTSGLFGGMLGIGGGVILVPSLVYLFGMTQHDAQGTTLATLIPPIGLLAAWTYYKAGHVDFKIAMLLASGFVVGSILGARFAVHVPRRTLRRIFGLAMLAIAMQMILRG